MSTKVLKCAVLNKSRPQEEKASPDLSRHASVCLRCVCLCTQIFIICQLFISIKSQGDTAVLDLLPLSLSSAPPQVDCTSMALLQVTNLPRSVLSLHIFPAETSHHPSIQTIALRNKAEQHSDKSSESSQRLSHSPSNSRTFISQAASASPSGLLTAPLAH